MSHYPAGSIIRGVQSEIESISEKRAKEIRHADVISHDPEGQRIKSLLSAALWDFYEYLFPQDDGKTTTVTTRRDSPITTHGLHQPAGESQIVEVATPIYVGVCARCKSVHDPRGSYDHAPVRPEERKDKNRKKRT
jgi:hypothetical protein